MLPLWAHQKKAPVNNLTQKGLKGQKVRKILMVGAFLVADLLR